MNCYNHIEEISVATCADCTKGLCRKCSDNFSIPICASCNLNRAYNQKNAVIKEFAWMILAGTLGLVFSYNFMPLSKALKHNWLMGIMIYFWAFYVFAGLVVGWNSLSKITVRYFLFLPLIGWFFYFFFKLNASMVIGIFATPFKIFKSINKLRSAQNIIGSTIGQ